MKIAGKRQASIKGRVIAGVIVVLGLAAAWYGYDRTTRLPSTDDATIDADIVHVAAAVGGRIVDMPVAENVQVAKGDLLFQIDPIPHKLAVQQAQADVELAEAALETHARRLSTQRSAALVAKDQTQRATTNLDLAARTVERLRPLAAKGYVPVQQLDQAETAQRDAVTSLEQAREQEAAAVGQLTPTPPRQPQCARARPPWRSRSAHSTIPRCAPRMPDASLA